MIKYEYRSSQGRHGSPDLRTKDEFGGCGGFISVFGFPEKASEYIETLGATRGVGQFPLYADTLYLDFDDNPEGEKKSIEWLVINGIQHTVYYTGNRGHHVHIPITPKTGTNLPHFVKTVVKKLFPGADESIYKATGVVRLPGTYHSKTRKPMVEVSSGGDKVLDLDSHRPKGYMPIKQITADEDPAFLDLMLTRDLNRTVSEGGRNNSAFHIAATAVKLKIEKAVTEELLTEWNETRCIPSLRDNEIKTILNSAYRGVL